MQSGGSLMNTAEFHYPNFIPLFPNSLFFQILKIDF